jgi:hypothetical protein
MKEDVKMLRKKDMKTKFEQLRYIDQAGETALSLALKIEENDEMILDLVHMDSWALGVRCKKTGNFPVHTIFRKRFMFETRTVVAIQSAWILCSYNYDGDNVLHLAFKSVCDEESVDFLLNMLGQVSPMMTTFIHQNKADQIPMHLALHQFYTHECLAKLIQISSESAARWELFLKNGEFNAVVFNYGENKSSVFGSFVCNESELSSVYNSTEYDFCGRIIQLESKEDCKDGVCKKRLIVHNFDEMISESVFPVLKTHKFATGLIRKLPRSVNNSKHRSKQDKQARQVPSDDAIAAADAMANILIDEEFRTEHAKANEKIKYTKKQKDRRNGEKRTEKALIESRKIKDEERENKNMPHKINPMLLRKSAHEIRIIDKNTIHQSSTQETALPVVTPDNGLKQAQKKLSNDNECCVCMEALRNTVLVPCYHVCLCESCASHVFEASMPQCPICCQSVEKSIKVFL